MKQQFLCNLRIMGGLKKVINSVDLFALYRSIHLREQFVFLTDGSAVNTATITTTEPHYNNYPSIACDSCYELNQNDIARIRPSDRDRHEEVMKTIVKSALENKNENHTIPMKIYIETSSTKEVLEQPQTEQQIQDNQKAIDEIREKWQLKKPL